MAADAEFVESVEFRADGVAAVTAAVADLDRQLSDAAVKGAAAAKALDDPAYRKSLAALDALTRRTADRTAQVLAEGRATDRLARFRSGGFLAGYREEARLREQLGRVRRLEAAAALAEDRRRLLAGDPAGQARADLRHQRGAEAFARDQRRFALAARLAGVRAGTYDAGGVVRDELRTQATDRAEELARLRERAKLSAADELRLARQRYDVERLAAAVAAKERAADRDVRPPAEARSAAGAARLRVAAAAEETRQAALRAGHERQARLAQLRGGGGLREAQDRLRAERETAALARQERANDLRARYGRFGRVLAAAEHPAARAGFAAFATPATLAASWARQGYAGTVEQRRLEMQEQRFKRNLAGGFKPLTDAYEGLLAHGNRFLERQSSRGQDQLSAAIGVGAAAGSAWTANAATRFLTGTSLVERAGALSRFAGLGGAAAGTTAAGVGVGEAAAVGGGAAAASGGAARGGLRLAGRLAGPLAAAVEAYSVTEDAQARGGGRAGWTSALANNSPLGGILNSLSKWRGGREDAVERFLGLPSAQRQPDKPRSTLTLADAGYSGIGESYDRLSTTADTLGVGLKIAELSGSMEKLREQVEKLATAMTPGNEAPEKIRRG